MAQLCVRRLISNLRQLPVSAASFISKRQFANEASPEDYGYYTDPLEKPEQSIHRRQMMAAWAGDDRYETKVYYKLEKSSPENPNLVPTNKDFRYVACWCEPDTTFPVMFIVHEGEAQRCRCGHWFKLVDKEGADYI